MSTDFGSARRWAERFIVDALYPGATAVDATLGNGYDAERLCALVGETGRVYGFDVQVEAVERTRARLQEKGLLARAELFCMGHERMAEVISPRSARATACWRATCTPPCAAFPMRRR